MDMHASVRINGIFIHDVSLRFTVLSLLYVASFAMFLDSIFKGTIFLVLARKSFNMLSINHFVDNKK